MNVRLFTLSSFVILAACVPGPEICASGQALRAGRCIPLVDRPVIDGGADEGSEDGAPPDGSAPDDGLVAWGVLNAVVVVDTTPNWELERVPASPGVDLDAVEVLGPGQNGHAGSILESGVNDPFGLSVATAAFGALGPADDFGAFRSDLYVSLGGGYLVLGLATDIPLASGHTVRVHALDDPPALETYELFLCVVDIADTVALNLSDSTQCRALGAGSGTLSFELR